MEEKTHPNSSLYEEGPENSWKFTKMIGKSPALFGAQRDGLKELSLCSFAKITLPQCQRLRSLGSFLVWVRPGKTKNHGTWKWVNHDVKVPAVRFRGYRISDLSCTPVSSYTRSFLHEMWTHPHVLKLYIFEKEILRPMSLTLLPRPHDGGMHI